MKVCGYTAKGRFIENLREVTFICSQEELAAISRFFTAGMEKLACDEAPEKHGYIAIDGHYCMEMRDYAQQWSRKNPAVILYVEQAQGQGTTSIENPERYMRL